MNYGYHSLLLLFMSLTADVTLCIGGLPANAQDTLSKPICDLGVNMLKIFSKEDGNQLISPISIGVILSLLQQGAEGSTSQQLKNVLQISPETSKEAYSVVLSNLRGKNSNVTLEWGNRIYIKLGFDLKEDFKTSVHEAFETDIEEINFLHPSPQVTADKMNKWFSDATHGQINDLVDSSLFNIDTVMVLLNAIYFKGTWNFPFDKARTRMGNFKCSENHSVSTSFMRQEDSFLAGEDLELGIKWLELPYEGNQFSMLFILPTETNGLSRVMDKMTGDNLRAIINRNQTRHVVMRIPKFKLMHKSSLESGLRELGLTELFEVNANLSGISLNQKGLKVSELVHQANIEVDEDGTTAAAETFGFVQVLSLITYPDEMLFDASHPFLFFIFDKINKIPLFAGRIANPQ